MKKKIYQKFNIIFTPSLTLKKVYLIFPTFWHPQQLSFHFPKPNLTQPESHTNNLHFKRNLVKIGLPYQKLLNFGRKSQNFPLFPPSFDFHYGPNL
jgi:hypothetical protein